MSFSSRVSIKSVDVVLGEMFSRFPWLKWTCDGSLELIHCDCSRCSNRVGSIAWGASVALLETGDFGKSIGLTFEKAIKAHRHPEMDTVPIMDETGDWLWLVGAN